MFDCKLIDLPPLPFLIVFLDVPFNSCVQARKFSFDNRVRDRVESPLPPPQEKVMSLIAPLNGGSWNLTGQSMILESFAATSFHA